MIAAGSDKHLDGRSFQPWQGTENGLPFAQRCGLEENGVSDDSAVSSTCSEVCTRDGAAEVVLPAVQMRRDGRGAELGAPGLTNAEPRQLGFESRIKTVSLLKVWRCGDASALFSCSVQRCAHNSTILRKGACVDSGMQRKHASLLISPSVSQCAAAPTSSGTGRCTNVNVTGHSSPCQLPPQVNLGLPAKPTAKDGVGYLLIAAESRL